MTPFVERDANIFRLQIADTESAQFGAYLLLSDLWSFLSFVIIFLGIFQRNLEDFSIGLQNKLNTYLYPYIPQT